MTKFYEALKKEFLNRDFSSEILRSRQQIIIDWMEQNARAWDYPFKAQNNSVKTIKNMLNDEFSQKYLWDFLRDLFTEESEIEADFKKNGPEGNLIRKSEQAFIENRRNINKLTPNQKIRHKNNIEILERYLPPDFKEKVWSEFLVEKSFIEINSKQFKILNKNVDEGTISKMQAEFNEKKILKLTDPFGLALWHYIEDNLVKKTLREKKTNNQHYKTANCAYCHKLFYPIMIEPSLISYLPKYIERSNCAYCQSCLKSAFWGIYKGTKDRITLKSDLRGLIDALGFIPTQVYFKNKIFIQKIPQEKFSAVMHMLIETWPNDYYDARVRPDAWKIPAQKKLELRCYAPDGESWLKTLIKYDILNENVRQTSRGIMCVADDNHDCRSIGEKQVCDWLTKKDIKHQREVNYPQHPEFNKLGLLRADWMIGNNYVEFFGLAGDENYDEKTKNKQMLCKALKISLIEVYPDDLFDLDKVFSKLDNVNS